MFSPTLFRRRVAAPLICAVFFFIFATPGAASSSEYEIVDGKALLNLGWGDNLCAVTFDDGPSRHTPRLLEILKERGVPATFFLVGNQIKYHGALVRRIQDEGHEVANHTLSHLTLRHRDGAMQRAEMEGVQKMLSELGVVSRFIRPPFGRYDMNTVRIAAELGLEIVLWSVDSMDWSRSLRVESMKTQVPGQKLRGIFLFHDTHAPTINAMPEILDRLAEDGCKFVTVSQFLESVRHKAEPTATIQAANQDGKDAAPPSPELEEVPDEDGAPLVSPSAPASVSRSGKEEKRPPLRPGVLVPLSEDMEDPAEGKAVSVVTQPESPVPVAEDRAGS